MRHNNNYSDPICKSSKTRFVFCHVILHVIARAPPVSPGPGLITSREPRKTRKKADDKSAHRRRRNNRLILKIVCVIWAPVLYLPAPMSRPQNRKLRNEG
jgi:hypothetical protein